MKRILEFTCDAAVIFIAIVVLWHIERILNAAMWRVIDKIKGRRT